MCGRQALITHLTRMQHIALLVVVLLTGCGATRPISVPAATVVAVTVIADGPAPTLGVVTDQQFQVRDVVPQSPAAQAGLQPGDRLRAWNGMPLTNLDQLKTLIGSLAIGSQATLTIVRAGAEQNLTVTAAYTVPPGSVAPLPTATAVPPELWFF